MIPAHPSYMEVLSLWVWGFMLPTVKIEPGFPKTEHMAVYFARWKDGSFSIAEADDEDEAYELLDEFGDEPAERRASSYDGFRGTARGGGLSRR
jgi:hypothetical protein